ncbi:MAG TPA: CGNR zinc finger domain-containing protein [Mycobacteriales bacterium]|nr:CGNR zinc finger domain-containing protein [Mycobacteriales bacterium]
MVFAHDTEVALAAAADLVNTARGEVDTLATNKDLNAFVREWGWTGSRTGDAAELAAVQALRPTLALLWEADEHAAVAIVNGLLREAHALPQLVKHDGWDYHVHATSPEAPLAERMAVEAAMAVIDVLRTNQWWRLQMCAGADCADVFVDLSKNRSRRFCSTTCSNRANVAAYRARRR